MSDMRRVGLKLLLSDDEARRLRRRAVEYERTFEGEATWLIKCALDELDRDEEIEEHGRRLRRGVAANGREQDAVERDIEGEGVYRTRVDRFVGGSEDQA